MGNKIELGTILTALTGFGALVLYSQTGRPPGELNLLTSLARPGISSPQEDGFSNKQGYLASTRALDYYLRRGFTESTDFNWIQARQIREEDITVSLIYPQFFQGSVVVTDGVFVRSIPFKNNAFLTGALNFGEPVTFSHKISIKVSGGIEEWGARIKQGRDGKPAYDFFMIKDSDGTELIKLDNSPEYPKGKVSSAQNSGSLVSHQNQDNRVRLRNQQPPNVNPFRIAGRVFNL